MNLKQGLEKYFGYTEFRGDQERIIESVICGHNVFVLKPTGAGKSLCYQLPALMLPGVALVISPLISLMKDQVDSLPNYADFLNSTLTYDEVSQVQSRINSGQTKLLYVSPESLHRIKSMNINISFVAVDEAHCISEYGHDFRPAYRDILFHVKGYPIIALTATATRRVQFDILKVLDIEDADLYISSFDRPNLDYEVREVESTSRNSLILKYCKSHISEVGIVYCYSRKEVDELTKFLVSQGISALPYHAGLSKSIRKLHQDMFMSGDCSVIVATNAFGMGINKPDIRYVIHRSMPTSIESYYQETGRAGRDGLRSYCLAFYSLKDFLKYHDVLRNSAFSQQRVSTELLSSVIKYCESSIPHRQFLIDYFK